MRAGQLLNYVGFVTSGTAVRESWSAPGDAIALAAHFQGWDPLIGEIIAAIGGPGGSGFQWDVNQALEDAVALAVLLGVYSDPDRIPQVLAAYETLRRERTARVQLGSRRQGAGYDSSGSALTDRRWIYDYDAWAEAAAIA